MDLFVGTEVAFRGCVLAAKHLAKLGAAITNESLSQQYYHAAAELSGHSFTIDIVLDENLFRIGKFVTLENQTVIGDLSTLLKMKAATLVSRCGEKDLYDVKWLWQEIPNLSISKLIELGRTVDTGVNAENMLASVAGTKLRESACDFSLIKKKTGADIYSEVTEFRGFLINELLEFLHQEPTPPLGRLVKKVKRVVG